MIKIGLSSYLTGLTNMASSCSTEIGYSYVEADCFDSDNFIKSFAKYYKIPSKKVCLKKTDRQLKEIFEEWFGKSNPKLIEGLMFHIESTLGKPLEVYECEGREVMDLLSGSEGGITRFYIMDDMCFVKFKNFIACFMLGNNE